MWAHGGKKKNTKNKTTYKVMSKIFGDEGKPIISKRIPRRAAFLPFWRLTSLSGHRIKMILKHNDYCQKAETAFRVNACRWFCLSGLLRCKKKAEEEERKKRTDGTAFWQQSTILLLASSFSSLAARGIKIAVNASCPAMLSQLLMGIMSFMAIFTANKSQ